MLECVKKYEESLQSVIIVDIKGRLDDIHDFVSKVYKRIENDQ